MQEAGENFEILHIAILVCGHY